MARVRVANFTAIELDAIKSIATDRHLSPSQAVAELIRESTMFKKAIGALKPKTRSGKSNPNTN